MATFLKVAAFGTEANHVNFLCLTCFFECASYLRTGQIWITKLGVFAIISQENLIKGNSITFL